MQLADISLTLEKKLVQKRKVQNAYIDRTRPGVGNVGTGHISSGNLTPPSYGARTSRTYEKYRRWEAHAAEQPTLLFKTSIP